MATTVDDDDIDIIDDDHLDAVLTFSPEVQEAIEQVCVFCNIL